MNYSVFFQVGIIIDGSPSDREEAKKDVIFHGAVSENDFRQIKRQTLLVMFETLEKNFKNISVPLPPITVVNFDGTSLEDFVVMSVTDDKFGFICWKAELSIESDKPLS